MLDDGALKTDGAVVHDGVVKTLVRASLARRITRWCIAVPDRYDIVSRTPVYIAEDSCVCTDKIRRYSPLLPVAVLVTRRAMHGSVRGLLLLAVRSTVLVVRYS